jgi:death on curing protein
VAESRGAHGSLARKHALVDGNKRIAWYATWVFLHMNGHPLDAGFDVDEAERFVLDGCQGALDMARIAERLPGFAR